MNNNNNNNVTKHVRRQSWIESDVKKRRQRAALAELEMWTAEAQEWVEKVLKIRLVSFFDSLKSGIYLIKLLKEIDSSYQPKYKENAEPNTFFARDNISLFLKKCEKMGVPKIALFEVDDLAQDRNKKRVVSTILYLTREAMKFGFEPPLIVQYELEIEAEERRRKELEKKKKLKMMKRKKEKEKVKDNIIPISLRKVKKDEVKTNATVMDNNNNNNNNSKEVIHVTHISNDAPNKTTINTIQDSAVVEASVEINNIEKDHEESTTATTTTLGNDNEDNSNNNHEESSVDHNLNDNHEDNEASSPVTEEQVPIDSNNDCKEEETDCNAEKNENIVEDNDNNNNNNNNKVEHNLKPNVTESSGDTLDEKLNKNSDNENSDNENSDDENSDDDEGDNVVENANDEKQIDLINNSDDQDENNSDYSTDEEEYEEYESDVGDVIDSAVAEILTEVRPQGLVMRKVKKGVYDMGSRAGGVTYMRLVRDILLVRVGGGWVTFRSFLERRESLKRRSSMVRF